MSLSLEIREEIKKRDKYRCVYCGCSNKIILNIDHKIPICRGGSDKKSNLVTSCSLCNYLKGSMTPNEFKRYMNSMTTLFELGKFNINLQKIQQHVHLFHGAGSSYNLNQ